MAKNTEVEELKKEIERLTGLINGINKNASETKQEEVLFTSLCVGELNLTTKKYIDGGGEVYTFKNFGEEQLIPYEDARDIIKNNKSFITGGLVFIHDKDMVEKYHLTKWYSKILDDDKMIDLFNSKIETFESIFNDLPVFQQKTFKSLLENKIIKKEKYDMNMVKIVDDALHVDIISSINNGKEIEE